MSAKSANQNQPGVLRLRPYQYIHVFDTKSGVTELHVGPLTYTRQDSEKVVSGEQPLEMVMVPPRHYVVIENPVVRDAASGQPLKDKNGNYVALHSELQIRGEGDPFPLYPGEKLKGSVTELTVVAPDCALRICAQREFITADGKKHMPGDEWLFEGPGTYYPRVEERVVRQVGSHTIGINQALKLRASRALVDRSGTARKDGEEWLHRVPGPYLPGLDEEPLLPLVESEILQFDQALYLVAERTFTDSLGRTRRAGEEWLVSLADTPVYIPDVHEIGRAHV